MAVIQSLVYKPAEAERRPEGRFSRVEVSEVTLVIGSGIQGDTKGRWENRELNIMRAETVAELAKEGFSTGPGELGEQLIIAGLAPEALYPGTRLRLGDAVIEVVKGRTPCTRFSEVQGKTVKEAWGRIGAMARVVIGGQVRIGTEVTPVGE